MESGPGVQDKLVDAVVRKDLTQGVSNVEAEDEGAVELKRAHSINRGLSGELSTSIEQFGGEVVLFGDVQDEFG